MSKYLDTIFAPITGQGGAVSVVRISGKDAKNSLDLMKDRSQILPRKATFTPILIGDDLLDHAVVTCFDSPNSFTGEDVIEFSLHGGSFLVNKFCGVLSSKFGFRFADPGEFSMRAVMNQKMNLVYAEGINEVIKAKTESQHSMALKMISGDTVSLYESWRNGIIKILALIETNIDFSDEDIPDGIYEMINKERDELIYSISKYLSANSKASMMFEDGIRIAIIGKPNVGKSSLINLLCSKDVAIVSDIPGTTRDSIEKILDIGGIMVKIIDTAGIRESSDSIERMGIERSIQHQKDSHFNIFVVDASDTESNIIPSDVRVSEGDIVILNKIDISDNTDFKTKELNKITSNIGLVSIKEMKNIDMIWSLIARRVKEVSEYDSDSFYINHRHKSLLNKAIEYLEKSRDLEAIELASEELRSASWLIGQIISPIGADDILGEIFSKFCIGK